MSTKADLELENFTLKNELAELKTGNVEPEPEKTVKLLWLHPVDNSAGMNPTAYGYSLYPEKDCYCAHVPESLVDVELTRGFVIDED